MDAVNDLLRLVASTRPGSQAGMEVWRKGAKRSIALTLEERPEDRVAALVSPRAPKPAAVAANRLGIVVAELSAGQKRDLKLANGLVVTEVRRDARPEVRKGDVILMLVHKGQQTELRTVEQFNRLLAGLDKNAVITLQLKRGDGMAFVTVSGLTDKG